LLVEYLSNVLIEDDPEHVPAGRPTNPAEHANPARTDPGQVPEGFVEYEHDGFSIAIPEAWSVEETGAETVISSRDQSDHIRFESLDLDGATPVEHFEAQERQRAEEPDFRGIRLEEVEHPDGNAAQWMYETGEDGTPMMLVELLVRSSDGEAAVLVFATGPERWEASSETRSQGSAASGRSRLGPAACERRSMMSTDNKRIPRRLVSEVVENGDLGTLDELIDERIAYHTPSEREPIRGREAYQAGVELYRGALSNLRIRIDDQIAEGDRVVSRWTATGRHDGELLGMPATGRRVEFTGIDIDRIENGRIVEEWTNWDTLGLMYQLGVIPEVSAKAGERIA
jgi:steroid delta-isomerase-like uncharacterized protein